MAREVDERAGAPLLTVERGEDDAGRPLVRLSGDLTLETAPALWRALGGAADARCDLSGVRTAQPGALALLVERLGARAPGDDRLFGAREEVARVLRLVRRFPEKVAERPRPAPLVARLGDALWRFLVQAQRVAAFAGELVVAAGRALRHPSSVRWRDVPMLCERAGVQAAVVVGAASFLAGLMLAFQLSSRLTSLGLGSVVADITGVAVTRHLAPFMTALMVAGRSGSAIAAELGTMQVTHEVDGLRVMGLDPVRYLVFPRVLSLALIVPVLTAYANITGIFGGYVVGVVQLDVPTVEFVRELRASLDLEDVVRGLLKALIFGLTIGLVACQRGLDTRGGPQDVGTAATTAVVAILFSIVALEALFAAVGSFFGL